MLILSKSNITRPLEVRQMPVGQIVGSARLDLQGCIAGRNFSMRPIGILMQVH
jgi:hypothetical protein